MNGPVASARSDRLRRSATEWLPPVAIAGAFLIAFFMTLSHYGMTWDETENFYTGERYFRFFVSGDGEWLRFPERSFEHVPFSKDTAKLYAAEIGRFQRTAAHDFLPGQHHRFVGRELAFAWPYTPVANIAAAMTDELFDIKLGWLDPIPAHHAAIGLFWAPVLIAVYRAARRWSGHAAAVVAAGTLALAPRIWGPVHDNIKDVPLTAMFALTLLALHKGVVDRRPRWVLAAGVLGGLTVGTKMNGAFVFVIAFLWLLSIRSELSSRRRPMRLALAAAPVLSVVAFFASWPYLWADPVGRVLRTAGFGIEAARVTPVSPGYALLYVLITTPLFVLAAGAFGIGAVGRLWAQPAKTGLFLIAWLAVPILRVTLPGAGFSDGIREYMEFWPALAIIAGIGAARSIEWIHRRMGWIRSQAAVAVGVVVLMLGPQLIADVRLHPDEDVYFNALAGGARGARALGVRWATDYYGNSYLRAVRWANAHLRDGDAIVAPVANHLVALDGLRPGIGSYGSLPPPGSAHRVYLVYITREEFYNDLIRSYDSRRPYRVESAGGVPILKIYEVTGG